MVRLGQVRLGKSIGVKAAYFVEGLVNMELKRFLVFHFVVWHGVRFRAVRVPGLNLIAPRQS